jgi:hypothetical protein
MLDSFPVMADICDHFCALTGKEAAAPFGAAASLFFRDAPQSDFLLKEKFFALIYRGIFFH